MAICGVPGLKFLVNYDTVDAPGAKFLVNNVTFGVPGLKFFVNYDTVDARKSAPQVPRGAGEQKFAFSLRKMVDFQKSFGGPQFCEK